MCGSLTAATTCISRRNRFRNRSSRDNSGASSFSATAVPSASRARYTAPVAPSPSGRSTRRPAITAPDSTESRICRRSPEASADEALHDRAELGLGLVEPGMRPAHAQDLLVEEDAAGRAVAERVEEDPPPDHPAVAEHDVPVAVAHDERLPRLDRDERVDVARDLGRLELVAELLGLNRHRPVVQRVREHIAKLTVEALEERLTVRCLVDAVAEAAAERAVADHVDPAD